MIRCINILPLIILSIHMNPMNNNVVHFKNSQMLKHMKTRYCIIQNDLVWGPSMTWRFWPFSPCTDPPAAARRHSLRLEVRSPWAFLSPAKERKKGLVGCRQGVVALGLVKICQNASFLIRKGLFFFKSYGLEISNLCKH